MMPKCTPGTSRRAPGGFLADLGRPGALLGPFWCAPGCSWAPLGALLAALGADLGPSWGLLGRSWQPTASFSKIVLPLEREHDFQDSGGPGWPQVGPKLAPSWPKLAHVEPSCPHLGLKPNPIEKTRCFLHPKPNPIEKTQGFVGLKLA